MEAACLLLLHLCARGKAIAPNSQIYSTALSAGSGLASVGLAVKMVRINPKLLAVVTIRETAKLLVPRLGTAYRALSADAGSNFGLSPAMVIHDEDGQWQTITKG